MKYKYTWGKLLKFEIKSLIGRKIFPKTPIIYGNAPLLNLGCGDNYIEGFTNADFYSGFWPFNNEKKLEWYLDLRYRLECKDEFFSGIFCEHVLEHLYPDEAENLLKELLRIMKEGSVLRITVPDLEKYTDYYYDKLETEFLMNFKKRFSSKANAIHTLTQEYFHRSLWDFNELSLKLSEVGFIDIRKSKYQQSVEPKLCLELESRKWETLYVECRKPLKKIYENTKII